MPGSAANMLGIKMNLLVMKIMQLHHVTPSSCHVQISLKGKHQKHTPWNDHGYVDGISPFVRMTMKCQYQAGGVLLPLLFQGV